MTDQKAAIELKPEMPEELYYLRRVPSGFLGNAFIWWCKDGQGYSAYLENAERMTKAKAKRLCDEDPEKWEMYPCSLIDQRLHLVFDHQDVKRLGQPVNLEDDWLTVDGSALLTDTLPPHAELVAAAEDALVELRRVSPSKASPRLRSAIAAARSLEKK